MKEQLTRNAIRTVTAGVGTIAVAVGLSLAVAAPAQAAAAGGTCQLSANWAVKFSANYTKLSGGRERTNYLVMNSPGPSRSGE
jgi:hypothetical protein